MQQTPIYEGKRLSMKSATMRGLLVAVAALAVLAVAAAPASATITAGAARTVTARSNDSALTRGGLGARCTTSTAAGTVAADGLSASVELDFSNGGRTTCTGSFGVSCEVRTAGRTPTTITLRSTSSTAGRTATGDVVIDANFTYEVACLGGGLVCTVSGAQTIRAAGTITQGTPSRLAANARGIRCTEGGTADFTGNYTITERITIS